MGLVRNVLWDVIDNCLCPTYRYLDDTDDFRARGCVNFVCGDHELEVYQVHKVTLFPRPCGFWEEDYEYVTELPNKAVTETFELHTPPCFSAIHGQNKVYRTKKITETKTIDTNCEFNFGSRCCNTERETIYGTECVLVGDPFYTTTYSGANTIGQHLQAGKISYYEKCESSDDCRSLYDGSYLSGPYSKFPTFMYGQRPIIKREGFFGLKATGLRVGLKYKYGYTVWRTIQPQGGQRSWTKVNDFRQAFIATSDEEEINPIPTNWDTLTNEQRFLGVSSTFTPVPVLSGYEYYVNNFGIIQDFGNTSCNAWITATDDGTTP